MRLTLSIGRLPPSASAGAHARIRPDWPIHQFDFAEPVLDQRLEGILGGVADVAAAVTVRNAPDAHPVENGVGLACRRDPG